MTVSLSTRIGGHPQRQALLQEIIRFAQARERRGDVRSSRVCCVCSRNGPCEAARSPSGARAGGVVCNCR